MRGHRVAHFEEKIAHGWIRDNGRWVSPEDVAKREAGAKKVAVRIVVEAVPDVASPASPGGP